MADTLATQSTTLTTVPVTTFIIYKDASGNRFFPVEYITGGSADAWTQTAVDITHGLPVQPMTGATWVLGAGTSVIGHAIIDSGTITAVTAITNALPAGTNVIGHVIVDSGTITTVTTVTAVTAITNALPAGTNILGKVGIDQTTPGTTNLVAARANAYRNGGTLHRSAITSADKLSVPGTLTLSDINEAGSTLSNVAYYVGVSAFNRWGPTGPGTLPGTITPTASHAVRCAFSAVTGADGYDIFLSVDASAPKWVTRITETQRAAGGIVSSVGGYAAGGAINSIDIGIVGTGLQTTVQPFTFNNAYTPATPTPINCAGYSRAHLHVKLAVTDLRSLPSVNIIPFFQDQTSTNDWFAGALQTAYVVLASGQPLEQDFVVDVDGATNLVVLIDAIGGQGAACSVWVELS